MALGWINRGAAPTNLSLGGITYDSGLRQIIGITSSPTISDPIKVYIWDGSAFTWTLQATTGGPPSPRQNFSICHDPVDGCILMYGGQAPSTAVLAELWKLDTTTWVWTQITLGTLPLADRFCAWVYDPSRDHFVLFGGIKGSTNAKRAETYIWNRTNFILQTPTTSPSARSPWGWCFDPITSEVMICCGNGVSGALSDTWTYGTDWTQRSSSLPATTAGGFTPLSEYDNSTKVLCANESDSHVLVWNGSWTDLGNFSSVVTNTSATMAFDAWSNEPVLIGGGITWVWDDTGVTPPPVPPPSPDTVPGKLAYYHNGAWHVVADLS